MTYPVYQVVQPPGIIRWRGLGSSSAPPSPGTHARFTRSNLVYPQAPTIVWKSYGETVSPPTPVIQDEQASNWQAHYWIHSKRRTKKDIEDERIALGILPPREQEQAEAAVEAVEQAIAKPAEVQREAIEDARESFHDAFKAAYVDAYVAHAVEEVWKEQVRKARRRRKAAILLLH